MKEIFNFNFTLNLAFWNVVLDFWMGMFLFYNYFLRIFLVEEHSMNFSTALFFSEMKKEKLSCYKLNLSRYFIFCQISTFLNSLLFSSLSR